MVEKEGVICVWSGARAEGTGAAGVRGIVCRCLWRHKKGFELPHLRWLWGGAEYNLEITDLATPDTTECYLLRTVLSI